MQINLFFFAKGYDTAKYLILISKIIKSHFNSHASIIEQSKSLQILLTYLFWQSYFTCKQQ